MYRILLLLILFSVQLTAQESKIFTLNGLLEPVEIITDQWGVPHIYAQNEQDLFFAQGWYAAKDRLFQFEIWRRQATGTVAEILGAEEVKRDIGTRLFKYRGDMRTELNSYHERGELIVKSYVKGVNAYIDHINQHSESLPLEFRLLGIQPQHWTPEVVISRHQGLLGNISDELDIARVIHLSNTSTAEKVFWFHPKKPILTIDPAINSEKLLDDRILELYKAYRRPVLFKPEHIIADNRSKDPLPEGWLVEQNDRYDKWFRESIDDIGSNNWVIDGSKTESGYPIMANDPHRTITTPSLRYMAHLHAPGWNVIGGGEPEIPGISIGHNEYGAWGLTVFATDAEDLYVYELHPEDSHLYKYRDEWIDMTIINDTIKVKDATPVIVEHAYTVHGPVTFIDDDNHIAYAVRCGWLEPGGSPYLASLRMDQSRNWEEFKLACRTSNIPGENMVWADREGNIGWQAVGIAPIRNNWSGLVPVPGDGRYEWDGYLPIMQKPALYNPANGIINTSNENVTPPDYDYWQAIGFEWSDPYRGDRVREVLNNGKSMSLQDMMQLQTDYTSIPARQLIPMLKVLTISDKKIAELRDMLDEWDFVMSPNSIEAGIYHTWESILKEKVKLLMVPKVISEYVAIQNHQMIHWLRSPGTEYGSNPIAARDKLLIDALAESLTTLTNLLGSDKSNWRYGQEKFKHITIRHPLSRAVNDGIKNQLEVGPFPRGGNSSTVNNTSNNYNQTSGASFRIIVDTEDWDKTMSMNSPGQNGDPSHEHYRNLAKMWAEDQFFPLYYSRDKIEAVAHSKWMLTPLK